MVTGFKSNAARLVRHAVQIGDRIMAVDSSLGGSMWPVSTVEGVISACTTRMPGQPVKMRFERPLSALGVNAVAIGVATPAEASPDASMAKPTDERQKILSSCRDILRRYMSERNEEDGALLDKKTQMLALVADKVLDAAASASISLDSLTLSMVMSAYLRCQQPDGAVNAFEASTGIRADGGAGDASVSLDGRERGTLQPSVECLNLYTASSLMRALAMKKDFSGVTRVLSAMEGRAGMSVDGVEVAEWGTALKPDSTCYNIALDSASKAGDLAIALVMFKGMGGRRDLVSYNVVIDALARAGRRDDALSLFYSMKNAGVQPDKYTYTSLIKCCVEEGDVQEMLYDMQERAVKPDVVTFNTFISQLCERGEWFEAKRMISRMESMGIPPNAMTYGLLTTTLLKAKKYRACLILFESACADPTTAPLTENVHVYTTAISAAAAEGNFEKAFDLIDRMSVLGIKPNQKTLTALMSACMKANNVHVALEVYGKIASPDGVAMKKAIEAHCLNGDWKDAQQLLALQGRGGAEMDGKQLMISYSDVLGYSLKAKELNFARLIFQQFLCNGFIPSKTMYRTMLETLNLWRRQRRLPKKDGNFDEAFKFLLFVIDALKERSLPCDGALYAGILSCGSQLGGLPRKISWLMTQERHNTDRNRALPVVPGWEDLFVKYDVYKLQLQEAVELPPLMVRANGKKVALRVASAENSVAYEGQPMKSDFSRQQLTGQLRRRRRRR